MSELKPCPNRRCQSINEALEQHREALEATLGALKMLRSLVREGGVPRYSVTPGAALNSTIEEVVDPAIRHAMRTLEDK